MARYGQAFKDRAVARLLPPESASLTDVAREFGVSVQTLQKWRDAALSPPAAAQAWTPAARFEALLTTAAMDEQQRNAWCRANGVYPQQLIEWRQAATEALGSTASERSSPAQAKAQQRRIKQLERDLRRKDKALAETAALLVLSKKLEAVLPGDEDA
ncbi:transposase [Pseudomonas helleri]|uniref:Transposase n=2 Tax=Pseudomonadota TaxID=1224 RepID=A0A6L5HYX9_9PSED|nr:transposase [Pseudomonas helleri]